MTRYRALAIIITLGALGAVPLITWFFGQPFYLTLFARIMVFAIAAVGVNFILSYGGLATLGHAAFVGLGAYVVGICVTSGITNGFAHLAIVIALSAVIAVLVGAVCLRTNGLFFIMITLAFGQLIYFVGVGLKQYGGDDGFAFRGHSDFGALLPLNKPVVLYYLIWAVLSLSVVAVWKLVQSRFGMALIGIRSNERRMRTLGLPTFRYRLVAFVISAIICAIAGLLLANLTQFVSPAYMSWARSGDLLIICLIGGVPTVLGPVTGALVFFLFEEVLSGLTEHWHMIFGPFLVLLVLFANGGLAGLAAMLLPRVRPESSDGA